MEVSRLRFAINYLAYPSSSIYHSRNPKLTKLFLGGGIALSYLYVGWAHYHEELEGALIAPLNTVQ